MDKIIRELVKKYWKELSKKENVRYFSGTLKPRIRDNIELEDCPCFRIYVTEKVDLKSLAPKDVLPGALYLDGRKLGFSSRRVKIEVDVYPIGDVKITEVCRTRNRPVKAGCSAMNYNPNATACTLGWFGINRKPGEEEFPGIVCNNHCGARENKASRGEPYSYPSKYDGGTLGDKIAEHWRHYPLSYNGFTCPYRNILHKIYRLFIKAKDNPVDSSFERITIPIEEVSYEIFKIGAITGKRRGVLGELAEKVGRTSGHTSGAKLIDNDWYGLVKYGRGTVFRGPSGLLEGNRFSLGGDSSSAVRWMRDKALAGLLYGGSESHTVFDHYDLIEKYLEVELIVP